MKLNLNGSLQSFSRKSTERETINHTMLKTVFFLNIFKELGDYADENIMSPPIFGQRGTS